MEPALESEATRKNLPKSRPGVSSNPHRMGAA